MYILTESAEARAPMMKIVMAVSIATLRPKMSIRDERFTGDIVIRYIRKSIVYVCESMESLVPENYTLGEGELNNYLLLRG